MSRALTVTVLARKGAAPRALRAEVAAVLNMVGEENLPAGMRRALDASVAAANKLIPAARKSDQLDLQIHIQETPLGGWSASVLVEVPTPTYPES